MSQLSGLKSKFTHYKRENARCRVLTSVSCSLADSLFGIAILNASIWTTRLVLFYANISPLWIGAVYDLMLSGLWMYGIKAQSSSDLTDREHLSPQPWYLERSCAELSGQDGVECGRGKTSFAVALVCM